RRYLVMYRVTGSFGTTLTVNVATTLGAGGGVFTRRTRGCAATPTATVHVSLLAGQVSRREPSTSINALISGLIGTLLLLVTSVVTSFAMFAWKTVSPVFRTTTSSRRISSRFLWNVMTCLPGARGPTNGFPRFEPVGYCA